MVGCEDVDLIVASCISFLHGSLRHYNLHDATNHVFNHMDHIIFNMVKSVNWTSNLAHTRVEYHSTYSYWGCPSILKLDMVAPASSCKLVVRVSCLAIMFYKVKGISMVHL